MENILDNSVLEEQQSEIILYAGFGPRFAALLLDGLILLPVTVGAVFNTLTWKSLPLMILFSLIPIIYKPFLEYKYGRTIGKKAMKLRVVNLQHGKANLQEVLLRNIFTILFTLVNIASSFVIFNAPEFSDITEFSEYSLISKLSGSMVYVTYLMYPIYLIEFIMVIVDEKKRSLHDRIGQTYVIKELAEWQKRIQSNNPN